jgi:hypothetical protein
MEVCGTVDRIRTRNILVCVADPQKILELDWDLSSRTFLSNENCCGRAGKFHTCKEKIGDLNPSEVTAFRAELYPLIMSSSMTQRLMRGLQQESRMGRIECNSESTNKKWIRHTISCVPDTYTGSTGIRDEGHQSRTCSSLNWRIHSSHDMAGEIW